MLRLIFFVNCVTVYTDLDVTAYVVAFLTDGFETSSVAMSFALYDLAVNPHTQDRLRADLEESLNKHGGELTYEVIQDTPYLDMVLSGKGESKFSVLELGTCERNGLRTSRDPYSLVKISRFLTNEIFPSF